MPWVLRLLPFAMSPYLNRRDAGRHLAAFLTGYRDRDDVLVVGLPRGGVPVAAEVAAALNQPLDLFVARKLGVPGHEEFAMGAVAEGDTVVRHDDVIRQLRIPEADLQAVIARERDEVRRREARYRRWRPRAPVAGKLVIVVDDGLATGATMEAAVKALRQLGATEVVVAAPVGARETCERLGRIADGLVCPLTPWRFSAVGAWYDDFAATTDGEIEEILTGA